MNAERMRLLFLAQQDQLRAHVQTATRLTKLYRTGQSPGRELDRALEVREEFAAHNQTETVAISRLMHGPLPGART